MSGNGPFRVRAAAWDDLEAVAAMLVATDVADAGSPDYGPEFLEDEWRDPRVDLGRDTWIVEGPDGEIAGYAFVLSRGPGAGVMGWGVVHPDYRGRRVGGRLIDLREDRARELAVSAPRGAVRLHSDVITADRAAHELHELRGYRIVRHFWRMDISLEEALPQSPTPRGVDIRTFERGRDDRPVHQALQEAFAGHWEFRPRPFEEWAAHRLTPDLDPGLWFVAVDGREVVGALLGQVSMGLGFVDVLGVRSGWRRRGVATSLLLHSFREFRHRGLPEARLYVDSENATGATTVYERAGMHVGRSYDNYAKRIEAGPPA